MIYAFILFSSVICISAIIIDISYFVLDGLIGSSLVVRKYSFALALGITYYIAYKYMMINGESDEEKE